jgi:uncharacterized protein
LNAFTGLTNGCAARRAVQHHKEMKMTEETKWRYSPSSEENVRVVKKFFEAMAHADVQGLLALSAEDIEWIIPGEGWPLAGTLRGHVGLRDFPQRVSETMESSFPSPPEYVAQGDRVLMINSARGRIKATNKTFEDDSAIAITVRNGKVTNIREYIDTQAVARASELDESPRHSPSDTEIAQSAL